jgi:FdhE protein
LAEWRGLEQFRWLRCGLCSAGWRADRMFCPFCETRDYRQLHELFAEGDEQKHRVSACDGCGGFLRGISTLAALSPPALLVAEVETLHLDVVARQRGYAPAPRTE